MSAELITYSSALLIGVLVGAAGCAVVYESRAEQAFATRYRAKLASLFERYRTKDGGRPGVLVPLAATADAPDWWLRRQGSAASPVVVLDRQDPVWPAARGAGAHRVDERLLSADTGQIGDDRLARVLREAGR